MYFQQCHTLWDTGRRAGAGGTSVLDRRGYRNQEAREEGVDESEACRAHLPIARMQ